MPEKALLVVSFGTSHLDTLEKTIVPIEEDLAAALPDRVLRRAFTSGMILRKLEARDGLHIDDVPRALEGLAGAGVRDAVVQPTHIMHGAEYDKILAQAEPFRGRFERLAVGRPLLSAEEDYRQAAEALLEALPERAEDRALVFMGHGTEHFANPAYCQLEYLLHDLGRTDVLVGTVEGYPGFGEVLRRLSERPGVRRVVLAPLMIVAGDHAKNDLAGPEPVSWKSQLEALGYETDCRLTGLGEYPGLRGIFVRHALEAAGDGPK